MGFLESDDECRPKSTVNDGQTICFRAAISLNAKADTNWVAKPVEELFLINEFIVKGCPMGLGTCCDMSGK